MNKYLLPQQLRESEEKYRAMMEQSSDMRYLHDLGGNIIEVNHEACKATSYTKKVIERMNVFDLHLDPSRKEEILKAWQSGGQALKSSNGQTISRGSTAASMTGTAGITLSVTPEYGWNMSENVLR